MSMKNEWVHFADKKGWPLCGRIAAATRDPRQATCKHCLKKLRRRMIVRVPFWAQKKFWDEPPAGTQEFWAFRKLPLCQVGDGIEFWFVRGKGGDELVAEAEIDSIEPPGVSVCEHSGMFKNDWKVFWRNESFKDLRIKQNAKCE